MKTFFMYKWLVSANARQMETVRWTRGQGTIEARGSRLENLVERWWVKWEEDGRQRGGGGRKSEEVGGKNYFLL